MNENKNEFKIADFGIAYDTANPHNSQFGGTPSYLSPEAENFLNMKTDILPDRFKSDVYSLGITMLEMTGIPYLERIKMK